MSLEAAEREILARIADMKSILADPEKNVALKEDLPPTEDASECSSITPSGSAPAPP